MTLQVNNSPHIYFSKLEETNDANFCSIHREGWLLMAGVAALREPLGAPYARQQVLQAISLLLARQMPGFQVVA